MANITISDLHQIETQFEELSTVELGTILGGGPKPKVELKLEYSQKKGASIGVVIKF